MEAFFNSDILKLIVILLSIITIVFLFLKYRKSDEHSNVHMYYISGLCIFLILELVTYICVNNDNATEIVSYVSFASTISSLFLSVVAIIYAIVSNNKGEAQYQKIDRASDRISSSVDRYSSISENLSGNINSILTKLDEIKSISNETRNAITQGNQQKISTQTNELVENIIDGYVKGGSFFGNLSLLSCIYSKDYNRPFTTAEIIPDHSAYLYGYIIASSALGVVRTHLENDRFVVDDYSLSIKEKLIDNINYYIENSIPDQKDYNNSLLIKIKELFHVSD